MSTRGRGTVYGAQPSSGWAPGYPMVLSNIVPDGEVLVAPGADRFGFPRQQVIIGIGPVSREEWVKREAHRLMVQDPEWAAVLRWLGEPVKRNPHNRGGDLLAQLGAPPGMLSVEGHRRPLDPAVRAYLGDLS